jgi:hypothetical protein
MNETRHKLQCVEFQSQLPELIGSHEDVAHHPHLQSCTLCRALLTDLETIARAAQQLFPIEEPPDNLWDHIQLAIENERPSSCLN